MALAERFADDEGGISTVIIASGESQVDAVTAAGLAGNLNAPILLTRSSRLPHNVARFIDEQNVTDVIVVGGTAAVPDAIVTAIESLDAKPKVERVSGDDRHATAAAIGNRLGGPNPTWCGSVQNAAILANGGDTGRADAVAVGPLAYALGLPILLTNADGLPDSTVAFLEDNKVERVVIIGGASAVSDDVEDALVEDVGVITVQRMSGPSAAATSVKITEEMLGDCADVVGTNAGMVALVNRDATADGITAAPVLGRGLGDGGPVPILLVGAELPTAVRDYLEGTSEETPAGDKTNLNILAIGGTAVVSEAVMEEAVAAAKTSSELTAVITPLKYDIRHLTNATRIANEKELGDYRNIFVVTFTDDVALPDEDEPDELSGTILDPTLYFVNGRRIAAPSDPANDESSSLLDRIHVEDRSILVVLKHHLEAGDEIRIAGGGKVAEAVNGDMRELKEAKLTLSAVTVASDRAAPDVEIVAAAGESTFMVYVAEPNLIDFNELDQSDYFSVRAKTIPAMSTDGTVTPKVERVVSLSAVPVAPTVMRKRLGAGTLGAQFMVTVTVDNKDPDSSIEPENELIVGDVIVVNRNTFRDEDGRGNAREQFTVRDAKDNGKKGDFEISSVNIGNVRHGELFDLDAAGFQTGHAAAMLTTNAVSIVAKAGGVAAGAQGNDWIVYGYDDREDAEDSTMAFDIDVGVDTDNAVISYTISDVKPAKDIGRAATVFDLAKALNANEDFADNFRLRYTTEKTDKEQPIGATLPAGNAFSGGWSSVGVSLRFNDAVRCLTTIDETADPVTYTCITDLTGARPDLVDDIAPDFPGSAEVAEAGDANIVEEPMVRWNAPDHTVHIKYRSSDADHLPERAGFRVIAGGVALNYGDAKPDVENDPETEDDESEGTVGRQDVRSIREILNSLRPDSSVTP